MKVAVTTRGGAAIASVDVAETATVLDLKRALHEAKHHRRQFAPPRQRLTFEQNHETVVLEDAELLSKHGITDGFKVLWKDLGPQIGFRAVYLIEYLGPLLIYPIFYFRLLPPCWYGACNPPPPRTVNQHVAFFLWTAHFIKRQLETLFVHEFGTLTMPVFNVFKNSAYYWGFAALVGWWVNRPTTELLPAWNVGVGFPWFCICMLLNFVCHLQLMYLRTPGTNALGMPRGFLFEYVTAPNYLLEILMWVGFNIVTGFTWAGLLFNFVGACQMFQWATEKHHKYRKLFKDYPHRRKIIIPFLY